MCSDVASHNQVGKIGGIENLEKKQNDMYSY